ncbi:MAG: hypothetical protein GEU91_23970 [Rhizobiales bacterium]|nr:hypothetical protein [Hyphomicrobiales bacterium]
MAVRTPVFVVCSPLERVGKTLIARLLTEFLIADGRTVESFDVNSDQPSLVDYLPGCTTMATIADTRGQMALFDRLTRDDGTPKVVDLGHNAFERFFTVMAQVGLVEEAHRRRVQVVVLFVASPGPAAPRAYAAVQRWMPGLKLVPVHNEVLGRTLQRDQYPARSGASLPLHIPLLAAGLHRIVIPPAFSFSDFRAGKLRMITTSYRFEIESWMKRVFIEFRELELRLLLATLRLSLQP